MAHSIKNGVIIYEMDKFLQNLLKIPLSLPSKKWMREWFEHWNIYYRMGLKDKRRNKQQHKKYCKERCHCEIYDGLARAVVNFAILYLEFKGIIPLTKKTIIKNLAYSENEKFLDWFKDCPSCASRRQVS